MSKKVLLRFSDCQLFEKNPRWAAVIDATLERACFSGVYDGKLSDDEADMLNAAVLMSPILKVTRIKMFLPNRKEVRMPILPKKMRKAAPLRVSQKKVSQKKPMLINRVMNPLRRRKNGKNTPSRTSTFIKWLVRQQENRLTQP